MKKILLVTALFAFSVNAFSQKNGLPSKKLKEVMTLEMALTSEDDMPGTRGASVVWHPVQKKYYAAMAGNLGYPLCVFDAKGQRLSEDDHTTQMDVRGLWYNPAKKVIQGNAYGDNGWFSYKLDSKGMLLNTTTDKEGQNQPDGQSVGAFVPLTQKVLFVYGSQVYVYNGKTAEEEKTVVIHWGRKKADGVSDEEDETEPSADHNTTTVVYTGIKGAELGFVNVTDRTIELYDMSNGFLIRSMELPEEATVESTFNFAYTNGMYWLFNMESRIWTAYK
ncbi:MAG TPA: hypothetical protein PKA77_09110 [Chitinophagaceae bacterium]|jgi:hypothetical protein|nr:hypothetical protein [Chitinophagaceae bacterium]HMU57881.1 hypothetical protein [Chitinophagaceae bacterium]